MANQATINTLLPLIRSRMNLTNVNTITDAEIKLFIRSSLAQLYEIIANRHRDYYVIPYRFSLVANQDQYALPADFRSAVQVFLSFGTAPNVQRLPLEAFTMNRYQARSNSGSQWPTMYRIINASIFLMPLPSAAATNAVELWYVPQWTGPLTDTATIDATLPNGWERWVEFDTCVQIAERMRLAEYFAMYSKERDTVAQSIISAASIRDESPQYMVDAFDVDCIDIDRPGEI